MSANTLPIMHLLKRITRNPFLAKCSNGLCSNPKHCAVKFSIQRGCLEDVDPNEFLDLTHCPSNEMARKIKTDMTVINEFMNESEEESFLDELLPYFQGKKYQFDHWDEVIHGYRETERRTWSENNDTVLKRVKKFVFSEDLSVLQFVHVLDLAEDGYIKPHLDSTRFCGNIIAGLSLLSDSVMRLIYEGKKSFTVDILLKRRSLYIMKDFVRYKFKHEILPNELSFFKGNRVKKLRRISVICRNEVEST